MKQKLLRRAINFAAKKHEGQRRDGGEPYIHHPLRVASVISIYVEDEEVLAAAILHDTLEDTNTTLQELRDIFGNRVARMVNELTYKGNLRHRIETKNAMLIKLADRLDNLADMQTWTRNKKALYLLDTDILLERINMRKKKQKYPKGFADDMESNGDPSEWK